MNITIFQFKYTKIFLYKENHMNEKIYIKFDYHDNNGPMYEIYDFKINEETTIKDIKNDLNNQFLFGNDLNINQYELYRGGENYVRSEQGADYFSYEEPTLLNDDVKLIDIEDERLILKVKLRLKLKINLCGFNVVYCYTNENKEDLFEKVKTILFNKKKYELKDMTAMYGNYEIDEELTTYNIYDNSTINIKISYNIDFGILYSINDHKTKYNDVLNSLEMMYFSRSKEWEYLKQTRNDKNKLLRITNGNIITTGDNKNIVNQSYTYFYTDKDIKLKNYVY